MKTKIRNFFMILCVFALVACSSDDDGNIVVDIEGVWILTSLRVETAFDFNEDGTATRDLFMETPCYDGDFINFRADGTVNIVSALTAIEVDVISSTEWEYTYECLNGFDNESTWEQNGANVTVENGSEDLMGTVSGNTLTVTVRDSFEIEMYDGMDFSYVDEDITLVYTKQ